MCKSSTEAFCDFFGLTETFCETVSVTKTILAFIFQLGLIADAWVAFITRVSVQFPRL